jgi:hypothetical protein
MCRAIYRGDEPVVNFRSQRRDRGPHHCGPQNEERHGQDGGYAKGDAGAETHSGGPGSNAVVSRSE